MTQAAPRSPAGRLLGLAVVCLGVAGCAEGTAARQGQPAGPLKIDMLWVLEQTPDTALSQALLVDAIPTFLSALQARGAIDLRFAATSMNMQCDPDRDGAHPVNGAFNQRVVAAPHPGPYLVHQHRACLTDADCERDGEAGLWWCRPMWLDRCTVNPNGSVNTSCHRRCVTDDECRAAFGSDSLACAPLGGLDDRECFEPQRTAGCYPELPPFLNDAERALVPCTLQVPADSSPCFRYEQGLAAALAALDPAGPNAAQAQAFHRDDAWLFIGFFTRETDCSTRAGAKFGEDFYMTCGYAQGPGVADTLEPVATFVDGFRALRADPERVFVAVIGGDSLAPDAATRVDEREAFRRSITDRMACHQLSTICDAYVGQGSWSERYQQVADAFGDHGTFQNWCAADYAPALTAIAEAFNAVAHGPETP